MPRKSMLMEHTDVPPEKSAQEIITEIAASGASQISQTFESGKIAGIRWVMKVHGKETVFDLPVKIKPVEKLLAEKSRSFVPADKLRVKAERIAWRQLFRWIQAQMAMVQLGQVEAGEVFMPYVFDPVSEKRLFQLMVEGPGLKALPAPQENK